MKFKILVIIFLLFQSFDILAQVNIYTREQFKDKHDDLLKYEKQYAIKTMYENEKKILETQRLNRQFEYICEKNGFDLSAYFTKDFLEVDIFRDTQASNIEVVYGVTGFETLQKDDKVIYKSIDKEIPDNIKNITKKCVEEFAKDLKIRFNQPGKERFSINVRASRVGKKCNTNKKLCTLEDLISNSRPDTVKYIDLSFSNLQKVPEEVFKFRNLKELDLSNNMIKVVPAELWNLDSLQKLSLSRNHLGNRDFNFKRNKKLASLNIQFNQISRFPKKIHKLKGLNDLLMGNNDLTEFSKQRIRSIKNLKSLNLYNAYLDFVPKRLVRCKNLMEIDLYHNNLKSMPSNYKKFKKLSSLAISYNDFWQLPDFSQYHSLSRLFAHHNKIDKVPNDLPSNMVLLDVGFNNLSAVPSSVVKLINLETLDISHNEIEQFEERVLDLPKLMELYYLNNPFVNDENFIRIHEQWQSSRKK